MRRFGNVFILLLWETSLLCKLIAYLNCHLQNQSWMFIGRTDAKAETPIHWPPPDVKNWLIWKDSDAGKDRRQKEKGTAEDEMVGWHQQLNGHEFEWTLGVGDGQGSLACCNSWGRKESDTLSNWTELNWYIHIFHFRILNLDKMNILYSDLKSYFHSSCHWAAVQEERNNKQGSWWGWAKCGD